MTKQNKMLPMKNIRIRSLHTLGVPQTLVHYRFLLPLPLPPSPQIFYPNMAMNYCISYHYQYKQSEYVKLSPMSEK